MMGDMAILTGGQFIAEELGVRLESLKISDFGRASRVVIDKDNTTIIGGAGKKGDDCGSVRRDSQGHRNHHF
jgi:chaperonin GroEL